MSKTRLTLPFPMLADIGGSLLEAGYVYIGEHGLDPEQNPITVYWDEQNPAAQPIRTLGGYLSRSGSPGKLLIDATGYSIKVLNKNRSLIYQDLSVTIGLQDGEVTAAKLADGAVSTAKLADGSVTTQKIADNTVTTAKINSNAITSAKIADGAVTGTEIADNAVTTAKIADNAITSAKIKDGEITAAKLASGAVPSGCAVLTGIASHLALLPIPTGYTEAQCIFAVIPERLVVPDGAPGITFYCEITNVRQVNLYNIQKARYIVVGAK